jgi:hypothetical protein
MESLKDAAEIRNAYLRSGMPPPDEKSPILGAERECNHDAAVKLFSMIKP